MIPAHEHDCERCVLIGSYRLRHPYFDADGYRSGTLNNVVVMGDLYRSCEGSSYAYIVRYGIRGEYATTNVPSRYILAPVIDGRDSA